MFHDPLLRISFLFDRFCVEKISWIYSMPISIFGRKIPGVNMSCDRSDYKITIVAKNLALIVVNRYNRRDAFFGDAFIVAQNLCN